MGELVNSPRRLDRHYLTRVAKAALSQYRGLPQWRFIYVHCELRLMLYVNPHQGLLTSKALLYISYRLCFLPGR